MIYLSVVSALLGTGCAEPTSEPLGPGSPPGTSPLPAPAPAPAPTPGTDTGEPFVVLDVLVSDPDIHMSDPEFESGSHRFAYSNHGDLWVGQLDPVTGALIPPDGFGEWVDEGLVPLTWRNGPEWLATEDGPELVYTTLSAAGTVLGHAWLEPSGWRSERLEDSLGRIHPIASSDPDDPSPRILYLHPSDRAMKFRYLGGAEQFLIDTDLILTFEDGIGPRGRGRFVPRWALGSHGVVYPSRGPVGRPILYKDVDTSALTRITADTGHYADAFLWEDPQLPAPMAFAVRDDDEGHPVELVVFQQIDGTWAEIQQLTGPSDHPYIISPEPVVFQGHSYVSYMASDQPVNIDDGNSQIWFSGLGEASGVHRRVSEAEPRLRIDPETYVTDQTVFVYYSAIHPETHRWVIHRCDTGL